MRTYSTGQRMPTRRFGGGSVRVIITRFVSQWLIFFGSVQLRPTVRPMAKALEYDVSLLERLYTDSSRPEIQRTMLDVCRLLCWWSRPEIDPALGTISFHTRTGQLPFQGVL
jgi:hypothetical protein